MSGDERAVRAEGSLTLGPSVGHVGRPRLVQALEEASLGVVLAGGGWGKSTLAMEFARSREARTAFARIEEGGDLASVRRALRRALRRAGLSDLVGALDGAADPRAAFDALVDGAAGDETPILLVVDHIEHADDEAVDALAILAVDLPPPHRAVLVGRSLPGRLRQALDSHPVVELGAEELAFTAEETRALARAHGLQLSAEQAERLRAASGGWAAAIVLAVERLRLVDDPDAELRSTDGGPRVFGELIAHQLDQLDPASASALVQLAHVLPLPRSDADGVSGRERLLVEAAQAGIPLELRADGLVTMSGPVREALAARAPLEPETARRAAAVHERLGDPATGVRLLVGAGDPQSAAALLARIPATQAAGMDYHELSALVTAIGPAVREQPRALLHLARACEAAAEASVRTEALSDAAAGAEGDHVLMRAVRAEQARDLIRDGKVDEAAALAESLLTEVGPDETQTRVRALHVLGRVYAWRADSASLAAAEPLLLEAAELYLALGNLTGCAHALLGLAYDVYMLGGRTDEAIACLERAAAVLPTRARLRGIVLDFHGEALAEVGRDAEAEAALAEAERLGLLLGDARAVAYAAWVRARIAARAGDAPRLRALLDAAERSRGDWFEHHTGAEFLAESATLSHELGLRELGDAYLERARARRDESPRYILLAEGMIEARDGDPATADRLLDDVLGLPDLESRLRWRAELLRAWAAHRAGDDERAAAFARDAFDRAAALGHPELPLLWERAVTEALLPLTGQEEIAATAARVTALGSFSVERGADVLRLPQGKPAQLVALVAAHGGRIPVDQAIEELWPGVDPESGRKRLRNVLNRLREAADELVLRDAGALVFADETQIDAVAFEREAERALAAPTGAEARAWAQAALARYTGELLPDHRYEDWAAGPRERLRGLALRLVDVLAAQARAEGELDDALRFLERGIELDPLDERRRLDAARILLQQGRRGRALDELRRAAAAQRSLGIEPSEEHRELVRATRS